MRKKTNSSEDACGISNYMIDILIKIPKIANIMLSVINKSLAEVADILKVAKIIPLPKAKVVKSLNEVRPISNIPVIAKVIEKCVYYQVIQYIVNNNILTDYQFGFRPRHSTQHAELFVKNYVMNAIENNKDCVIVALDFRKAFDTVNRNILLKKISDIGIDVEWFRSYLSNRQQYVIKDGKHSETTATSIGIVQGGCLSGILFSILINDIPEILKHVQICLYADDSQILKMVDPDTTIDQIKTEEDCLRILDWMVNNDLCVNIQKTNVILHQKRKAKFTCQFKLKVGDMYVEAADNLKSLGILKDKYMSWTSHINETIRKCNIALWSIRNIKYLLNYEQIKLMIESNVLSKLYYMIIVWGNCNKKNMAKVNKIFKAALKLTLGKYSTCEERIKLGWLPPTMQYQYELSILAFKCKIKDVPNVFKNYWNENVITERKTRSDSKFYVNKELCTDYVQRIIMESWVLIPEKIRFNEDINCFKNELKIYLLEKEFVLINDACDLSCIDDVIANIHTC